MTSSERLAEIQARREAVPHAENWHVESGHWAPEGEQKWLIDGVMRDKYGTNSISGNDKAACEFIAAAPADVDWLLAEVERLQRIWPDFTSRIGFGDGVTEPAAGVDTIVEHVEHLTTEARDHAECPIWCDECTDWEMPRTCQHCKGSGYGGPLRQSMENVQGWTECDFCAGDGRHHAGPYSDRLSAAEARVETLQRDVLQALIVQVELDRSTAYWGERWDWFPDELKAWLSSLIDFGWTATAVPGMPQPTQGEATMSDEMQTGHPGIRLWVCPNGHVSHDGVMCVEWDEGAAHCNYPGCDHGTSRPQPTEERS